LIGSILMYSILNLMANNHTDTYTNNNNSHNSNSNANNNGISIDRTVSIAGYSILPLLLLSILALFFNLRVSALGLLLSIICIIWCAFSATRMFEKALDMREQRYLIAYPALLLYAVFALLTIL
jgi:cation transport ATPase